MFTNLFRQDNQSNKPLQLFQDSYLVAEIESVQLSKNRKVLTNNFNGINLYLSQASEQNKQYCEIIYAHKKLDRTFMIYHHETKETATKVFDKLKPLFDTLDRPLQTNRHIEETLKLMMKGFKSNPQWTATHFAAMLGLEAHFIQNQSQVEQEMNVQEKPDLVTPFHLAIINANLSLVMLICKHFKPNLDLVDANRHSALHFAAISTREILYFVLHLPEMFNRILWKDINGSTALHLACFAENFVNICEFLKFGLTAEMLTLPTPKLTFTAGSPNDRPKSVSNQNVIKLNEEDFYDLDFTPSKDGAPSDIVSIGGLLHWVKHNRLMEKLLQYDFDVNTKNLNGDTPLHVMVKRGRLLCVLILLCNGARVDSKNIFGNTALYHAVQMGHKMLTQTLIVFDADINAQNNKKLSIRHEAASGAKNDDDGMLLFLLSSIGARRCPSDMIGCKDGCKHDGKFEGRLLSKLSELDSDREQFFTCPNIEKIVKETIERNEQPTPNGRQVNLLTLDGGGIKGLISLQILIEIENRLKQPIANYFRWICGTSTGSIIAACLAMGKSLRSIRDIYFILKNKLFNGPRPYSSNLFEKFLKEKFGPDLLIADLKKIYQKHVIIPAVLFDRSPMQLHLFRSYESPNSILDPSSPNGSKEDISAKVESSLSNNSSTFFKPKVNEHVWKVCRASGAAPTYFRAFGAFIDGGMIANNPTLDALTEMQAYNTALIKMKRESECEHLNLVLSVGCGRFAMKKTDIVDFPSIYTFNPVEMGQNINYIWNFFHLLLDEVVNTDDHVVKRAEATCSRANIPYFRINSLLSQEMELDEKFEFKIINAMWETKRYMYIMRDQVLMLANYIEKTSNLKAFPPTSLGSISTKQDTNQSLSEKETKLPTSEMNNLNQSQSNKIKNSILGNLDSSSIDLQKSVSKTEVH